MQIRRSWLVVTLLFRSIASSLPLQFAWRIDRPSTQLRVSKDDSDIVTALDALESPKKARQYRLRREEKRKARRGDQNEATEQPAKVSTKSKKKPGSINRDIPYEAMFAGLKVYFEEHEDLVMPRRFVISPQDVKYPADLHGIDLPCTVYSMQWWQRHVKQRPERVAQLNDLGFVWQRMQPEWNLVMEALITYISIYGDLLVPSSFVVPYGDSKWPKATWKMPLGNCVYRIRSRHDFLRGNNASKRREQLDGLGFVWDVSEHKFRVFGAALVRYARLEAPPEDSTGRSLPLDIPTTFVVPSSSDWPEQLWGYPLGAKCSAVRQKQLYIKDRPDRKQALAEIGFHWNGNADMAWLKVVHAAAIYSRLNGRNLDVPLSFVVPEPPTAADRSDWPWPESLWGLKLGQRLKDIRSKGAYLHGDTAEERRRQLDALGFVWKPKRGRRSTS